MSGNYGFHANVSIERISVLSVGSEPQNITVANQASTSTFNETTQVVIVDTNLPLSSNASFELPISQANMVQPSNTSSTEQDSGKGGGSSDSGGSKEVWESFGVKMILVFAIGFVYQNI